VLRETRRKNIQLPGFHDEYMNMLRDPKPRACIVCSTIFMVPEYSRRGLCGNEACRFKRQAEGEVHLERDRVIARCTAWRCKKSMRIIKHMHVWIGQNSLFDAISSDNSFAVWIDRLMVYYRNLLIDQVLSNTDLHNKNVAARIGRYIVG